MSSIKTITSALAGVLALTTIVSAETTVTLPDVNASIYGKLNYSAYYNEDTSGNGTWTSGNNSSRIETSMNAAQKELALHQTALSRTADGDFSKDLAEISKSRIARSQNAALMAQAISVSRDVANLLL